MKKIISFFLCFAMLAAFSGCSRAPEYSEIRTELESLVEQAYIVNNIFFGDGFVVYERVYDPRETLALYTDDSGNSYYYYTLNDENMGTVIAYRAKNSNENFAYLLKTTTENTEAEAVFEKDGFFYYAIDYTEKTYDFFYTENDPEDYDYVRTDQEYSSVEEIKTLAESVYSTDYLDSIYETLFTGVVIVFDDDENMISTLKARYISYENTETGEIYFMQSNVYTPLISGKRIYDFDSAVIVKPSKANYVNIEINSWLEESPENVTVKKLSLVKQDGVWRLDNASY